MKAPILLRPKALRSCPYGTAYMPPEQEGEHFEALMTEMNSKAAMSESGSTSTSTAADLTKTAPGAQLTLIVDHDGLAHRFVNPITRDGASEIMSLLTKVGVKERT
ncbi:hypothetical protein HYH02_011402 [Chlamydomonas schloesseri]|uniref:Uncharacterized protein n=1 Tax=Chlamydomonas schloesseri TaxID=2026947 RepID=A0A835T510_9CHLO|nr:hypothetical protein HYH02_011402 [Chlamydomonas schloesseri]|eukprot:KAG2437147.1 hypothetical protein HYH02_011402 [Chlamydomonas schloesseri]